jgi:putative ABC transport system permease protein
MSTLRQWWHRLVGTMTGSSADAALRADIEAHLDQLTDDFIARGMTPEDARFAAQRAFGGVDQIRELYRDQRGLPVVDALMQDVRFGLRLLVRDRGFTLAAIVVLGAGLGVNNLFFTLVYAATMRGLPLERADRVVHISMTDERAPDRPVSWQEFVDLRSAQRSFTGLTAFASAPVTVGDEGRAPDRLDGTYLSANGFGLLDISSVTGRTFTEGDDRPGAAPVVLLGEQAWKLRYDGDPGVLGRTILVNGSPATIVGIIPDRSGFPTTATVWLPLAQMPGLLSQPPNLPTLRVLGRLGDAVTVEDARADLQSIVDGSIATRAESRGQARARVIPINERVFQPLAGPWIAFALAACLVVLISSANVANLMIGRSQGRAHELAIRASLGAGRGRLVRQLVVESAVLAAIATGLAVVVSVAGVQIFQSTVPRNVFPYWNDFSMDLRIFGALCVVAVGTIVVFGLIPAVFVSRSDPHEILKNGRRTGASTKGAKRWMAGFLTAELALAVIFLSQAVLVAVNPGPEAPSDRMLDTPSVVAAAVTLPAARYRTPDERRLFYTRLVERITQAPGASSVAIASHLPLAGAAERRVTIDGQPPDAAAAQPAVGVVDVDPGYFETLALPLVGGRRFSTTDGMPGEAHVIVNERFAQVFFVGRDPIGQRIALVAESEPTVSPTWLTVVGIAQDVRQRPRPVTPIVYVPILATAPSTALVVVRAASDPSALAPILRASAQSVDPNVPLYRMTSLSQARRDAEWNGRVSEGLALTLTLISLLLATVGLYAVTAHAVTLRNQEIGIRMALGAQPAQVVRTILQSVRIPLGLGFILGILGTFAWDRAFSFGGAGARVADPRVLLLVTVLLAALTVAACFAPARRATRLDPVAVLREE